MKSEPALKYGLIVGLIAMIASAVLGIQITEDDRLQLDTVVGLLMVLIPLIQSLVQGWLTRRKVMPVNTIEQAGLTPEGIKARAGKP